MTAIMAVLITEKERVPGVCYAQTSQGVELPVVDVSHPSFALDTRPEALAAVRTRAAADTAKWERRPRWLRRLLFGLLARRSVLLRGLRSSHGTFLSGMNTYLFKLGPAHLASSFATATDRRLAAGAAAMEVRFCLQCMAELLAEKLAEAGGAAPAGQPVRLLNVAGGPAMDDLNALILVRQQAPAALAGRPVRITVLDLQEEAPEFGRRALAALQVPGAPLAGGTAVLEHRRYDWHRPETLRELLAEPAGGAVALGSSEGGLFHYGDDAVIRANLAALREFSGPGFSFTGTMSPDTQANRAAITFSGAAVRYFQMEVFEALVCDTGWRIERRAESLRSLCVRLVKA
jgi:hypothetical protein